jgi:hypothetical protein
MLTLWTGRDDVADLHLFPRHDHAIDEQLHQVSHLVKRGLSEALLHSLAKGLDALGDRGQFHLTVDASFQLPHLRFDSLLPLL